jgi:(2Fe-2S) ferredoxin
MTVFKKHVFVCVNGKKCPKQGSEEVLDALREEISELGLKKEIRINKAGCFDQCGNGPMVVIYPDAVWYAHVEPKDAKEIVRSHLLSNKPVKRLLYDERGEVT